MDLKLIRVVTVALMVVLLSFTASATVDVDSVSISPATPDTTDNLQCAYTVSGNLSQYTVNVTWSQDGTDISTETVTAQDSVEEIDTLNSGQTAKGEDWECSIVAADDSGNTDSDSDTVTIVNSAPSITSSPDETAETGVQYSYQVDVNDDDDDTITYSLTTSPTGMTISDTGLIRWTPAEDQVGSADVNVRVNDGSAVDTQSYTVEVTSRKLIIQSFDVNCDPSCDDDDVDEEGANEGDAGRVKEVQPGTELTLRVRVENIWPDGTDDHDIEDIELECTLEDIGDDDEQEETIDFNDLEPDERSDREEMVFDVSNEAEDDETYTIECILIGEDQDGTDYEYEFDLDIDVEKEPHSVVFESTSIDPATISCNRNFIATYDIKNLGGRDEDYVQVTVENDELDIFNNQIFDDLESGDYDDEDTEASGSASFRIDDDVAEGIYRVKFEVFYDDNDESEVVFRDLEIRECVTTQQEEEEEEEEPGEVVIITQDPVIPTQQPTQQPVVAENEDDEKSETVPFTESNTFIALLIVAIIFLMILGAWMLSIIFRR